MKRLIYAAVLLLMLNACSQKQENMKNYVIEVTTFQYTAAVDPVEFWKEDAKVDAVFTSRQPGYISRESAYSKESNEVVVVVRWQSSADADASMAKFMSDASVKSYASMIDGASMKMTRYEMP